MKMKVRNFVAYLLVLMLISTDIAAVAEAAMKTLTLPAALKVIEEESFYGNTSIEKVVVPDGTTEIRSGAFANSSLKQIDIPASVQSIAADAFSGCGDFDVTAPYGSYAFDWAARKGILIIESAHPYAANSEITWNYVHPTDADELKITFSSDTMLENGHDKLFITDSAGMKKEYTGSELAGAVLTLPGDSFTLFLDTDVSVQKFGFKIVSIKAVTKETVPAGLKYAPSTDGTYMIITGYTGSASELIIPGKIEGIPVLEIDNEAFYNCDGLVSIDLTNTSLTNIGDYAFYDCDNLANITLPDTLTNIGFYAFVSCDSLANITLPDTLTNISDTAFYECNCLVSIDLANTSLTNISNHAFSSCDSLANITLPDTLTNIGYSAFYYCNGLVSIDLANTSLTNISTSAFSSCDSLANITLPDTLTNIGEKAFYSCANLESINLPESLVNIGNNAFKNCQNVVAAVVENSYAHTWCKNNGVNYVLATPTSTATPKPTATPAPTPTPFLAAPQITVEQTSYKNITIGWNAVEGAEAYDIYCAISEDGEYVYIGTTAECRFTHNDLMCNTAYYYKVKARNENEESEFSNPLCVITEEQHIPLEAPAGVLVQTLNESQLKITWNTVVNADGYKVFCGDVLRATVVGGKKQEYICSELEANTRYDFCVKAYAYKNNGEEVIGTASNYASGKTADILSVVATAEKSALLLSEAMVITTSVEGNYGDYTYRYTVRKGTEIVAASGECEMGQYSFTPDSLGSYNVVVVVTDSLGRTAGCQIDEIMVSVDELVVNSVNCDKSMIMLGEAITLAADTNRAQETLTYSANIYRENIKVDNVIGVGKLTYTPSEIGTYSFAVEITDSYGQKEYAYLDNAVKVVPKWGLVNVTPNATQLNAGENLTFTAKMTGTVDDVTFVYTIYKDYQIYFESGETNQTTFSIPVSETGTYRCLCTATDKNYTRQAFSSYVSVIRNDVVNDLYTTPTHGNTLNINDVDDKDSDEVQIAQGAVTITWDKRSTDSYYSLIIECNTTRQELVYETKYTKTSYTIASSDIKAGYEYDVALYRYNSKGTRTLLQSFEFVVLGGKSLIFEADPKIIVPAKNASVNYADLTIQWSKMNYASTIEIILEYDCGIDDHEILRQTVSGTTSTYTIPKSVLQNGAEHYLRINVKDSLGNSKWVNRYFYVGCEEDNVTEITAPVLTDSYMSTGYDRMKVPTYPTYEPITISWEENPYASYFSLHLKDYDNGDKEIVYNNIKTNSYTVQPSALVSGHRYQVNVYAYCTNGCKDASDTMWFRAPYKANLKLDPPVVRAPELSTNAKDPYVFVRQDLTIEWEPVSAAKNYSVVLCEEDDHEWIDFEANGLTGTKVTIPRDNIGTDLLYMLIISAYDSAGNETCQEYYVKAVKSNIEAPRLLTPQLPQDQTNIPAFEDRDLVLTWTPVEGAVNYRVQVRDYYGEEWDLILDQDGITEEAFTIPRSELYEGGKFRVRIKAIDQYGNGKYSDNYYFQIGSSQYVGLTITSHTFSYEGGSKAFFIETNGEWSAEASDSWISISRKTGNGPMQLKITVTANTGDFPRSGSVTFTNSVGGCAVFSVMQEGNGAGNAGALKITSPEQGEILDYAKIRTAWSYMYDHAYYVVTLRDTNMAKTVFTADKVTASYLDIPQSVLKYGHTYQLGVAVFNAKDVKVSESSIVFAVETLNVDNDGTGGSGSDDGLIEEPEVFEGAAEIIYTGIKDGANVEMSDINVRWQNVIGADYYWVAMRDTTLYPTGKEENVVKIIDEETNLLKTTIFAGQLTAGHSYNLWIAAHKEGVSAPIDGKNISFNVRAAEEDSGSTTSGVPTATLSVKNQSIVLGEQIALSGKVLANGGILNQIRITVQDAQTGEFCDYAIYDLAAIGSYGYYDQFDLANVYPIVTGEGTCIETCSSGYARKGSESLYLDTVGKRYNIIVYGKNNGSDVVRQLASSSIELVEAIDATLSIDMDISDSNIVINGGHAFEGAIVCSGAPLYKVCITVEDVSTGEIFEYATYDMETIKKAGNQNVFDLSKVPALILGENSYAGPIHLGKVGNTYITRVYARAFGDKEMSLLATKQIRVKAAPFIRVFDSAGNDMNGTNITLRYDGVYSEYIYVETNISNISAWNESDNIFQMKIVDIEYTDNGNTLYTYKVSAKMNPYAQSREGLLRVYDTTYSGNKVDSTSTKWATIYVSQAANPYVPIIAGAAIDNGSLCWHRSNPLNMSIGASNYPNGYTLTVNLENNVNVESWTVYTDNNEIAEVYRSNGLVYVTAKAKGVTNLYISHKYAKNFSDIDPKFMYKVCEIRVGMESGATSIEGSCELEITSSYYNKTQGFVLVTDDDLYLNVFVREKSTGKEMWPSEIADVYRVECEILHSELANLIGFSYKDGVVRITDSTRQWYGAFAKLKLIKVATGTVVQEVQVVYSYTDRDGWLSEKTYTSLVARIDDVERATSKYGFILDTIGRKNMEIYNVQYRYSNDKPQKFPEGYYTVTFDVFNGTRVNYGVVAYDKNDNQLGATTIIAAYSPTTPICRVLYEGGHFMYKLITEPEGALREAETQKTSIMLEVPVDGYINIVGSADNETVKLFNGVDVLIGLLDAGDKIQDLIGSFKNPLDYTCINKETFVAYLQKSAIPNEFWEEVWDVVVAEKRADAILQLITESPYWEDILEGMVKSIASPDSIGGVITKVTSNIEEGVMFLNPVAHRLETGVQLLDIVDMTQQILNNMNDKDSLRMGWIMLPKQ